MWDNILKILTASTPLSNPLLWHFHVSRILDPEVWAEQSVSELAHSFLYTGVRAKSSDGVFTNVKSYCSKLIV
jgi:hypothetical protein